jgi:hypothetical protein
MGMSLPEQLIDGGEDGRDARTVVTTERRPPRGHDPILAAFGLGTLRQWHRVHVSREESPGAGDGSGQEDDKIPRLTGQVDAGGCIILADRGAGDPDP